VTDPFLGGSERRLLTGINSAVGFSDLEADVRSITAWALGEIESASALQAVRNDGSPSVRRAVQWAIAQIDDRR